MTTPHFPDWNPGANEESALMSALSIVATSYEQRMRFIYEMLMAETADDLAADFPGLFDVVNDKSPLETLCGLLPPGHPATVYLRNHV